MEKIKIISNAIVEFYEASSSSKNCVNVKSQKRIEEIFKLKEARPETLIKTIERGVAMYVKIGFFAPVAILFQEIFDQILHEYAEQMENAYQKSDEAKKMLNGKKSLLYNKLSSQEVDAFIRSKNNFVEEKACAEKRFWDLHNVIKTLGFETWGDQEGYKPYLLLKKE